MQAGRQGILQWSEEAGGVPSNLLIPRTQAGIKEPLWNSMEPGVCAWRQVDACGGKGAVRSCRRIPRIQMEAGESAEFEDSGGSWGAFVELRGIRQTPKLEAATKRHGKC